jgi:hypothetical protein
MTKTSPKLIDLFKIESLVDASPKLEAACESVCDYVDGTFENDLTSDLDDVRSAVQVLRDKCHEALQVLAGNDAATSEVTSTLISARVDGVKDGLAGPPFEMGMTYPNQDMNEAYDEGVNLGLHLFDGGKVMMLPNQTARLLKATRVEVRQVQNDGDNEGVYRGILVTRIHKITALFFESAGNKSGHICSQPWQTTCVLLGSKWREVFPRQENHDMINAGWTVILGADEELPAGLQETPVEKTTTTDTEDLVMAARKLLAILEQKQNTFVADLPPVFIEKLRKALPPSPVTEEE